MYSEHPRGTEQREFLALIAGRDAEVQSSLRQLLTEMCGETLTATRLANVGKILRYRNNVSVLLCFPELDDAGWREVAGLVRSVPLGPELILVSDTAADGLWAELISAGGFGLLNLNTRFHEMQSMLQSANNRWLRAAQVQRARADNLRNIYPHQQSA